MQQRWSVLACKHASLQFSWLFIFIVSAWLLMVKFLFCLAQKAHMYLIKVLWSCFICFDGVICACAYVRAHLPFVCHNLCCTGLHTCLHLLAYVKRLKGWLFSSEAKLYLLYFSSFYFLTLCCVSGIQMKLRC